LLIGKEILDSKDKEEKEKRKRSEESLLSICQKD